MRVSSTQMIGRYQKQLNDSYENQTKLMEQSDGSKLHRPSDDSVNYSKYLRYQNSSTENEQYQSNVKTGISWMKTADSAMVNMVDIMTTLKEKTIQAATDTNGEVDVQAIGKEYLAKVYELVSLGNTQQGDRYMFAGQSDLTQPFTVSSEKKDRGLTKTLDDPQKEFFKGEVDDSGNVAQMLELTTADNHTYYMSTLSGNIYSKQFMDEGYKERIADGRNRVDPTIDAVGQVPLGTDFIMHNYYPNGVIRDGGTQRVDQIGNYTITRETYGEGEEIITVGYGGYQYTAKKTTNANDEEILTYTDNDGFAVTINTNTGDVDTSLTSLEGEVTGGSASSFASSSPQTYTLDHRTEKGLIKGLSSLEFTEGVLTNAVLPPGPFTVTSANKADYDNGCNQFTINNSGYTYTVTSYPARLADSANFGSASYTNMSARVINNSPNPNSMEYKYSSTENGVTTTYTYTVDVVEQDANGEPKRANVTVDDGSGNPVTYSGAVQKNDDGDYDVHFQDADKKDWTLRTFAPDKVKVEVSATKKESLTYTPGTSTNLNVGSDWSGSIDVDGDGTAETTLTFATIKQYVVEYSGDAKSISMVKRNGAIDPTADTVNTSGQKLFGSDIFDNVNSGNQINGAASGAAALNDMLCVAAKMDAGDVRWLSSDGITLSDVAHSKVLDAETTVAARQNVYDSVSTMLDKQNETITEDISNASDADVAKLAVMLMTMQTIYNMSLSVGSRILPQSLTDYLG